MFTLEWDDPQHTILRLTFPPGWMWEEFLDVMPQAAEMFDGADYRVDTIFDFQNINYVPMGMTTRLSAIASMPFLAHDRAGIIAFTNADIIQKSLLKGFLGFFKQYRETFKVADSLEEARNIIAETR